jgi:hypothetical protein
MGLDCETHTKLTLYTIVGQIIYKFYCILHGHHYREQPAITIAGALRRWIIVAHFPISKYTL